MNAKIVLDKSKKVFYIDRVGIITRWDNYSAVQAVVNHRREIYLLGIPKNLKNPLEFGKSLGY